MKLIRIACASAILLGATAAPTMSAGAANVARSDLATDLHQCQVEYEGRVESCYEFYDEGSSYRANCLAYSSRTLSSCRQSAYERHEMITVGP